MSTKENYEVLKSTIEALSVDFEKFDNKKVKVGGQRTRNHLLTAKKLCDKLRRDIMLEMRGLPTKLRISVNGGGVKEEVAKAVKEEVKEEVEEEAKEEVTAGISTDGIPSLDSGIAPDVTTDIMDDPNVSIPSLCEITREITIKPKRKRKANKTK